MADPTTNPRLLESNAFGSDEGGPFSAPFSQITLRDLFAAAVLNSIAADIDPMRPEIAAARSYKLADAMLHERAQNRKR